MSKWWDYVETVTAKARPVDISEATGIASATISRWNPGNKGGPARPDPDKVVTFAREYNRSPLEALIAADYISAEDIGQTIEPPGSMKDVTDVAFIGELTDRLAELRRLQRGENAQGWSSSGWASENPGMGRVQDAD